MEFVLVLFNTDRSFSLIISAHNTTNNNNSLFHSLCAIVEIEMGT